MIGLSLLLASGAAAQTGDGADIPAGARVRISSPRMSQPAVGTLLTLTTDSATLDVGDARNPIRLPLSGARIERSRGRGGHPVAGAVIGAAALGLYGWMGRTVHDDIEHFANELGGEAERGVSPLLVAAGGAAAGALIGSLIRTEGWNVVASIPDRATRPAVAAGVRVRVGGPAGRTVGTVQEVTPGGVSVAVRGRVNPLFIPASEVTYLDVSRARRRHPVLGAGIGLAAGGVVGALIGFAEGDDACREFCIVSFSAGEKAVMAGAMLGGAGALAGLIVGFAVQTDEWTAADLPGAAIAVTPLSHGDGVRVGVTIPAR